MSTYPTPNRAPEVIAPGSGHHLHFLNHLATLKVRAGEDGALSVVEFTAPRGLGPPLHEHEDEDECFVVLSGEVAFHVADDRLTAGEGGVAFLPHGVPHTFQVRSETARFLCVTGSRVQAPRFDRMVVDLGADAPEGRLPEPGPVDAGRVTEVCRAHGIAVLGPPPAALGG
ncbi:MAG: cupin domain-containing protein [Actinomycetota bacterium]